MNICIVNVIIMVQGDWNCFVIYHCIENYFLAKLFRGRQKVVMWLCIRMRTGGALYLEKIFIL